jgi:hypothetical protein
VPAAMWLETAVHLPIEVKACSVPIRSADECGSYRGGGPVTGLRHHSRHPLLNSVRSTGALRLTLRFLAIAGVAAATTKPSARDSALFLVMDKCPLLVWWNIYGVNLLAAIGCRCELAASTPDRDTRLCCPQIHRPALLQGGIVAAEPTRHAIRTAELARTCASQVREFRRRCHAFVEQRADAVG